MPIIIFYVLLMTIVSSVCVYAEDKMSFKETPNPPELWVPYMNWGVGKGGALILFSVIYTPNSCHKADGHTSGFPQGTTGLPETYPIQLHVKKAKAPLCARVITPIYHVIESLKIPAGKTNITAFSMLGTDVKEKNSIAIPTSKENLPSSGDIPIPLIRKELH